MTSASLNVIDELENALAGKNIGHRAVLLRRVTDLFVSASGKLSDEQIALFDDVMSRLVEEIESSARASFGHVLMTLPDAPPGVTRRMALDDAIDVAGPILSHCGRLDDATLVESAKTKSQEHLLAISHRQTLAESVTDILVERGNQHVVSSTAGNPGAAFSQFGYSTLVQRSSGDEDLALCIWSRSEIPRQHLLQLFADATESTKRKLTSHDPRRATFILEIVAQASSQIQTRTRERSRSYAAAQCHVQSLHDSGRLGEAQLGEFAQSKEFEKTVAALSIICNLPIDLAERAFVDQQSEQIIVMAKAAGLSWESTKALLLLQAETVDGSKNKLNRHFETFLRLKAETAKKAMQFYRLRERAARSRPD